MNHLHLFEVRRKLGSS